jgi:anti-anti-sigma factor
MWIDERDTQTASCHLVIWKPEEHQDTLFDRAMLELDKIIAQDAGALWVVDVSAISMLSSNAIAQLISIVRRVNLAQGKMVLARPAPAVASVLRMTRLTKLLPMYDDIAQAKTAVQTAS